MHRNDPRFDDDHDCLEAVNGDESMLDGGLCPKCRQAADVEAQEQEMMARRADPNMHNMVDAQANAIDHGAPRGP